MQLQKIRVILGADNTVIFAAGKNSAVVANKLNHDLATLENTFIDNSLIVNFKKTKTEFVPFYEKLSGTSTVEIIMNWRKTIESENYKYLGGNTVAPPGIFIGGKRCWGLGRSPRKFLFGHALYFGYKRDQRPLHRLRSR